MKNNTKIKLAGVLLGAALSSTGVYAGSGSCGASKCGGEAKKMEKKGSCGASKCGAKTDEMKGNMGKKSEMKCAAGKCGADMKMEKEKHENYKKGHMKKDEMMEKNMMKKEEMMEKKMMKKEEAKKKVEGSCGAGKCG